jgi:hypothetical protein
MAYGTVRKAAFLKGFYHGRPLSVQGYGRRPWRASMTGVSMRALVIAEQTKGAHGGNALTAGISHIPFRHRRPPKWM